MKKVLLLLAIAFTLTANAQKDHNIGWLFLPHKNAPLDTQAHILGNMAIGGPASLYWYDKTENRVWAVVLGTATMFAFNNFKEAIDTWKGGSYDWNDIGWGTGFAFVSAVSFNVLSANTEKQKEIERLNSIIEDDAKLHEMELLELKLQE